MLIIVPAMQAEFSSTAYRKACQTCVSDSFHCSLLHSENSSKIKMTMPVRINLDSSIMNCVGGNTQSADFERKFYSTSSPARRGIGPRTFSTSSKSTQSNSRTVRIIPAGAYNINTPGFSPSVFMDV